MVMGKSLMLQKESSLMLLLLEERVGMVTMVSLVKETAIVTLRLRVEIWVLSRVI